MTDLTFTQEIIKTIIGGAIPITMAAVGGQWIINQYQLAQKEKESHLELARFIRERQYESLEQLYCLFGRFMALYRIINSQDTDLSNLQTKQELLRQCAEAESSVDSIILRVASEFTYKYQSPPAEALGDLRQSVQIWRERVSEEKRLPFTYSEQEDYVRFKRAFAWVATYLSSIIFVRLEPLPVRSEAAQKLILDVFSNIREWHGYHDVYAE
jgi:hypothetical protein